MSGWAEAMCKLVGVCNAVNKNGQVGGCAGGRRRAAAGTVPCDCSRAAGYLKLGTWDR
jgi:hypothetical protein